MKRVLIVAIVAMFACVGVVYAGVIGSVTGYVKAEAWALVIGGVIGALGMFGVSYKLWGQAAKELGEFVWSIYAATRATSNGGKEITRSEMEKILKEGAEIYPAVAAAIASRKKVTA